jgi:hypothetical protein
MYGQTVRETKQNKRKGVLIEIARNLTQAPFPLDVSVNRVKTILAPFTFATRDSLIPV